MLHCSTSALLAQHFQALRVALRVQLSRFNITRKSQPVHLTPRRTRLKSLNETYTPVPETRANSFITANSSVTSFPSLTTHTLLMPPLPTQRQRQLALLGARPKTGLLDSSATIHPLLRVHTRSRQGQEGRKRALPPGTPAVSVCSMPTVPRSPSSRTYTRTCCLHHHARVQDLAPVSDAVRGVVVKRDVDHSAQVVLHVEHHAGAHGVEHARTIHGD
jgi:hypothetical protein